MFKVNSKDTKTTSVVFIKIRIPKSFLSFELYHADERRKISSSIRQKGESQNEYFKETKHAKFSKNEHVLALDTHTYVCGSRVRKVRFSENLACFVFLKHAI